LKALQFKLESMFLSKWFYYVIIAIFLALIYYLISVGISYNNDFALRFNPTLIGLIINFAIFIVFFDLREYLASKKVEGKVKWRIGWEIYAIFGDIVTFCEVDNQVCTGDGQDLSAWKDWRKRQLDQLSKGKIVLGNYKIQLRDSKISEGYASMLASRKNSLSGLEDKYSKFLSLEVQSSLMDIQVELEHIGIALWRSKFFETKNEKELTEPIEKIIGEMVKLREKGIGIGF
jgi:hypothetical protein